MSTRRTSAVMTTTRTLLTAALTAGFTVCLPAQERPAPPRPALHSIRPLCDLAEQLEAAYAKPITFEEPLLVWRGDQEEEERIPGRLRPKYRDFTPPGLSPQDTPALTLATLGAALDAYHSQTDGPRYTVKESKMGFHIVPVEAAGADGTPGPPVNLLDTVITVPYARRSPTEHFHAVCEAIAKESGVAIVFNHNGGMSLLETLYLPNGRYFHLNDMVLDVRMAGGPVPLTPEQAARRAQIHEQMSIGWGATGVTARDAIISLLEPSATTLTWQFLCQGGPGTSGRRCILNLSTINIPETLPNGYVSARPLLRWDRCTANCPKLVQPPLPLGKK